MGKLNIYSITNDLTSFESSEGLKVISEVIPSTFSNSFNFSFVIVSVSIDIISFPSIERDFISSILIVSI